jgi:RNA polymerase sigma-70 factor (ECF subfamily)
MRAFLYRVANNLIIDDVRKKKELSLDALNEQGFDPLGDDESSVVQRLKDQQILQILKKLPAESRELIIMRHIDGLKPQDISDLLGLAPNTVSVRIHRAMKDLKAILKPQSQ